MRKVDVGLVVGVIFTITIFIGMVFGAYKAMTFEYGKMIGRFIRDIRIEAEK